MNNDGNIIMTKKRIYFFAKVGDLNQIPYGGGEVGNRRTMQMLKELGYDVCLINRYYNYDKKSLLTYTKMIIGDMLSWMRMCVTLALKKRKNAVVHISGFTGSYMPFEFLSVLSSKLLGFNTTYEIRGGGIVGNYEEGNSIYKWMFKQTVKCANTVFSQGKENEELTNKVCSTVFFHYPNCVNDDFMPATCPQKVDDKIRLLYLGRISPQKNVHIVVEILNELKARGYKAQLDIIGDGEDCKDYVDDIKDYVEIHHLISSCIFHGKMRKNDMIPYLQKAHFFLFPTEEKREGQSNSLTETMSFGIIPIASSQGYNKSTIANDLLIEDTLTAKAYSDKIISIWNKGDVTNLSQEMYNRINTHFTYQQVKENVSHIYAAIFTDQK